MTAGTFISAHLSLTGVQTVDAAAAGFNQSSQRTQVMKNAYMTKFLYDFTMLCCVLRIIYHLREKEIHRQPGNPSSCPMGSFILLPCPQMPSSVLAVFLLICNTEGRRRIINHTGTELLLSSLNLTLRTYRLWSTTVLLPRGFWFKRGYTFLSVHFNRNTCIWDDYAVRQSRDRFNCKFTLNIRMRRRYDLCDTESWRVRLCQIGWFADLLGISHTAVSRVHTEWCECKKNPKKTEDAEYMLAEF